MWNGAFSPARRRGSPKRIVVDYDGTLFDKGIYPIYKTFDFLKGLQGSHEILVVTARKKDRAEQTEAAVREEGLHVTSFIYGRGQDEPLYKAAIVDMIPNVVLAIDNNQEVLQAYRDIGVKAIHPKDIPEA